MTRLYSNISAPLSSVGGFYPASFAQKTTMRVSGDGFCFCFVFCHILVINSEHRHIKQSLCGDSLLTFFLLYFLTWTWPIIQFLLKGVPFPSTISVCVQYFCPACFDVGPCIKKEQWPAESAECMRPTLGGEERHYNQPLYNHRQSFSLWTSPKVEWIGHWSLRSFSSPSISFLIHKRNQHHDFWIFYA